MYIGPKHLATRRPRSLPLSAGAAAAENVRKANFQFIVHCLCSEGTVRWEKDDIYHEINNNEDFCHYSSPASCLLLTGVFSLSSHRISPAKRSLVLFLLGACSDTLSQLSTLTAWHPRSSSTARSTNPADERKYPASKVFWRTTWLTKAFALFAPFLMNLII